MKNKIFIVLFFLLLSCIVTNCSKVSPTNERKIEPVQSIFSLAPEIESFTKIQPYEEEFNKLTSFLETANQQNLICSNPDLTKVVFKDIPSMIGIQLSLESENPYMTRDLLSIYDDEHDIRFTLIREVEGFCDNQTGSISYRSLDDSFILSTHYKDGYNIYEYSSLQENAIKGLSCTYEEFGEFYFAAKQECESDWLCDLACSFNPCSLVYLASAAIECAKNE